MVCCPVPEHPVPGAPLRLFFALWPDETVREQIWRVSRPAVAACEGRPVVRENLHMTLAFLGSVKASLLPEIRASAADLQMPGFEFSLDELGFWAQPRVLVVRPTSFPRELPELVNSLWQALEPLELTGSRGAGGLYRPHVTVARKAVPAELVLGTPVRWAVRDFCLVRSVTDPAGARYEPLARYHLMQASTQAGDSTGIAGHDQ